MCSTTGILEPFVLETNKLLSASLSTNTWKSYNNGLEKFEHFRNFHNLALIWPPPVHHLANFIAYLSKLSYSPATVRLYVSSVGFANKFKGLSDTSQSFLIQKMLNGANKLYGKADIRCPITLDMAMKCSLALKHVCFSQYEASMFWAAFSLSFFGLLRIGELTILSSTSDSSKIIQNTDVEFINTSNNRHILLTLRFSKTDQFGISSVIRVEEEENLPACPVSTLKAFLDIRPKFHGPLFCYYNKKHVTRIQFVKVLHDCLKYLGYKTEVFNTHSFRIGGAAHLFQKGANEAVIKNRGSWSSNSYNRYIRC